MPFFFKPTVRRKTQLDLIIRHAINLYLVVMRTDNLFETLLRFT